MSRKRKIISLIIFAALIAALRVGIAFTRAPAKAETLSGTMRDAVLHESARISFFGLVINPGLMAAFVVTMVILVLALILRIFVIPRFRIVPGKIQLILEKAVGLFQGLAKSNSPHRNGFLSVYVFGAGVYIFIGTLFELFGIQAVTTAGHSISLPAPLSDINGAIMLGCLSYGVIMSGGIIGNRIRGVALTLKDFSLPISMSFRLFGALLSGALVTELVYYTSRLSYGLPVFVGVMFTLLHALIQAYVLTMLTSLFYGEVSEPKAKKKKKTKNKPITEEAAS